MSSQRRNVVKLHQFGVLNLISSSWQISLRVHPRSVRLPDSGGIDKSRHLQPFDHAVQSATGTSKGHLTQARDEARFWRVPLEANERVGFVSSLMPT